MTAGLDRGNGLSLLIADDDPAICRLVRRLLPPHKVTSVEAVDDGQRALQALALHPFAGVILDHDMPTLSGLEVARLLRSEAGTRNLPIMIISAVNDPATVRAFLSLGIEEYVLKPINPVQASVRVDAFIRRCEAYDIGRMTARRAG